jgi:hypothetical protein
MAEVTDRDAGFAAVDALVALMILAATITLSLRAVETARRAALGADEMRQATQMLRGLLDTPVAPPGALAGQTPVFLWRVETRAGAAIPGAAGATICARAASVTSRRDGRRFALDGAEICPPDRTP